MFDYCISKIYGDICFHAQFLRSVANFTRRDATEFLALAAEIPIRTVADEYPLADANLALERLAAGDVSG
ncbi:MAG: alcohol dehydrogenase, partial [Deltaproteobacteria bacterium]|nr:alcohol dehydrogenase [Deltaproteobacteria bacterium]